MSPEPTTSVWAAPAENNELIGLVDVDMAELSQDIADDGVAGASADQVPGLLEVIEYAQGKGHDFSFVVVERQQPRFSLYRDIANQLQEQVGGTVIVLGPNSVGSSSPDFSRVEQEQATNDLALEQPAVAARQMVDSLTGPHVDWTLVSLGLILVVAVGAVVARLRARRSRAALEAGPLGPVVDARETSAGEADEPTPAAPGKADPHSR